MQLLCRLAHNTITGNSRKGCPDPVSRAANRAPDQSTKMGKASRWGRAGRWPCTSTAPKLPAISVENGSAGYFVRDPGRAGERMPERVVHRQGRMGEHPAARSDVQIGVGVVERRHRLSERPNEGGEPGDQRPRRDEPA